MNRIKVLIVFALLVLMGSGGIIYGSAITETTLTTTEKNKIEEVFMEFSIHDESGKLTKAYQTGNFEEAFDNHFIGTVTKKVGSFYNYFNAFSTIYEVNVTKVMKGNVEKEILIVAFGGLDEEKMINYTMISSKNIFENTEYEFFVDSKIFPDAKEFSDKEMYNVCCLISAFETEK